MISKMTFIILSLMMINLSMADNLKKGSEMRGELIRKIFEENNKLEISNENPFSKAIPMPEGGRNQTN